MDAPHRLLPTSHAVRTLYRQSGNGCAYPGCAQLLVTADGTLVGEIAFIEAATPDGPRFRTSMADEERHASANLLLLCSAHHTVIDRDLATWTAEKLRELKADHEASNTGAVKLGRNLESGRVQGLQLGAGNTQHNYFAPVTQYVFSGPFERLRDVSFDPAPLARDLDLARFTGREWLIEQIDAFIDSRPRGYIIIQAEAGVGKSTLIAHLAWTRPWLYHFTRLPGGRSPEAARKSLAAQLIAEWNLAEWAPEGVLPAAASRADWFGRILEAVARERDQAEPRKENRVPIVIMVDGLDEAEPEPGAVGRRGLPLGLPESMPDGVYVVATSRYGIDRALHAVRNPADWLAIDIEGAGNQDDMRRFLQAVTSHGGDTQLTQKLRDGGVDADWFCANLAQSSGGIWIYLRYVLDEIRDGSRSPRSVGDLPADLAGFYAEQVTVWQGREDDEAAQQRWEQVRLPLLGVLGAARGPLSLSELVMLAAVPSPEAARVFIEGPIRAFLSSRLDPAGEPRYALRHQSLRDLLTGKVPHRPDLGNASRMLSSQVQAAHRMITSALTPPGRPGQRNWTSASMYARRHLAAHAAACGKLDALAADPGFLLATDPAALLEYRWHLATPDGKRALAAFDLSLGDWAATAPEARLELLAVNAARVRAAALGAACITAGGEWLVLWAAWTGQVHRKLSGHRGAVNTVSIGRAGNREVIVSGADDAKVRIWDPVTGSLAAQPLTGHDGPVRAVVIGRAGDCDVIVSGSEDGTVRIWDAVTGNAKVILTGHEGPVNTVAIGQAGKRYVIVSGSDDGTVRTWDAVTGTPVGRPRYGYDCPVDAVAIGQAGSRSIIIGGSRKGKLRVWHAATGLSSRTVPGSRREQAPFMAAMGRAGTRDIIVSGTSKASVRAWDAVTGEPIGRPLDRGGITAVAIGQAAARDVIVAASGRRIEVWDIDEERWIGTPLTGDDGAVNGVAIGRVGSRDVIVSACADGTVRIWDEVTSDLTREQASGPIVGHGGSVRGVAVGQVGNRDVVVSGSTDATVRVWDALTGAPADTSTEGPKGAPVNAVAMRRAGGHDFTACGDEDGGMRVWDHIAGHAAAGCADHGGAVRGVAIGQAGGRNIAVSGTSNCMMGIWDALTVELVSYAEHPSVVNAVAIGRAGDREVIIVSGSDDATVRIWDAATGYAISVLTGHGGPVNAVAIGRAGDRDVIVSGSDDATIRIWDGATFALLGQALTGHDGPVRGVAIGRAGDRDVIVSGSEDRTVRVWNAVTHASVSVLAGHTGAVNAVAIGRAGDRDVIVSGSDDRTLLVRHFNPLHGRPAAE